MRRRDGAELVLLAALWGASFLFMRLSAAEFGPLALVFVRVAGAAAVLLALLAWHSRLAALAGAWRPLLVVGIANSAVPFVLFSLAALVLEAGLSGILNATAPLWGAVVAWVWLGDRLDRWRLAGLAIGFAGVLLLAWDRAGFKSDTQGISPAVGIAACLLATLCYGFAANYTKRHLSAVPPMVVAAGSQLAAALVAAGPAWWAWPVTPPSARAWAAVAALAVACTGLAYLLYFRLIRNVGAAQAVAVTYLIPVFAIAWGLLFLGERITGAMIGGCLVVLLGTALATGFVKPGLWRRTPLKG